MKLTLYIGLLILNVFDSLTTMAIVTLHGVDAEANPIMQWILTSYGTAGMWGIKAMILLIIPLLGLDKFSTHFYIVLNIIFSLIVTLNLIGLIIS